MCTFVCNGRPGLHLFIFKSHEHVISAFSAPERLYNLCVRIY